MVVLFMRMFLEVLLWDGKGLVSQDHDYGRLYIRQPGQSHNQAEAPVRAGRRGLCGKASLGRARCCH